MTEASFETVKYNVNDGIAEIVLDRPPLNLIDYTLANEYLAALKIADADESVRVIILRGNGRGLSAGVDLKFLESFNSEQMHDFLELFYVGTIDAVRALSKPIIAAVHGYVREGACTLAFACDMIIAAGDADFGYPGVPNLAGPPGMHVWFLQKLIGRMKAAELIFTGEPISASQAESLGLITRVVDKNSLLEESRALAAKIATMSPLALQRTRDLMYQMEDMPFSDVPRVALKALAETFDSDDSKEARNAFLEKRPPVWKGT